MGFYINPKDTTKEAWLEKYGVSLEHFVPDKNCAPDPSNPDNTLVVVCWVDNGVFTAAGICYSQDELEAFKYADGREKRWYIVPLKDLEPFLFGQEVS